MDTKERWNHLNALDDELLKGGVMLSEWCTFIVRETDTAFVGGAHLACILTAVAGIETYLRSEVSDGARQTLSELIDGVVLDPELRLDLHNLRRYRNKWVHVNDPWEDADLLEAPEKMEEELERWPSLLRGSCGGQSMRIPGSDVPPNRSLETDAQRRSFASLRSSLPVPVNSNVTRHTVSTSRIGLVPFEPDGERLVAYLERRTPWDS